jgi:hypothetical protein
MNETFQKRVENRLMFYLFKTMLLPKNNAKRTINFNVKSVLECGGAIIKTIEENFISTFSKSPVIDGD